MVISSTVLGKANAKCHTLPNVSADGKGLDEYSYVFFRLVTGEWKRYGTPFLLWFILLHLLWAVMSPFVQILLSTEIVKTPKTTWSKANTSDIIVKLGRTKYYADKYLIYRLLCCENSETTSPNDSPSLLWPENENCTFLSATSLNKTI